MDENTQYGFPMTKQMPTGCIKEHQAPSWLKFLNLLLETVDLDDKIGHLFVTDNELNQGRAAEWEYIYYDFLSPIIQTQNN